MTCGFLIPLVFCQKNTRWFTGVEVNMRWVWRIYVKRRKLVVWHRILSIGQSRRSANVIATCPIHGYPVDFASLLCVLPSCSKVVQATLNYVTSQLCHSLVVHPAPSQEKSWIHPCYDSSWVSLGEIPTPSALSDSYAWIIHIVWEKFRASRIWGSTEI